MLPKIDTPIYETKLISTGEVIKFRPFLVKEQKLFLMASESGESKDTISVIKQVLNNCILSDIDVNSLPTFDLENLFLHLRARSVGEVVNLKFNCNNVVKNENNEDKVCGNLVKIDVNVLEIEPTLNEKHNSKIEITPKLGIVLKHPTFDLASKLDSSEKDVNTIVDIIIDCIDYIYDEENMYYPKTTPREELVEFIDSLQQKDLEKIQNFFDTMPKITKKLEFKCSKCNYEEKITLEGIQSFFV
jgi:hypothetical protein